MPEVAIESNESLPEPARRPKVGAWILLGTVAAVLGGFALYVALTRKDIGKSWGRAMRRK